MRVIHIQAEQGHAVPRQVLDARGPFGRYEPERATEDYPSGDFPPGATAQNGMREVVMYECRACGAAVREDALDSHGCKE
jgi:hypothetical protein